MAIHELRPTDTSDDPHAWPHHPAGEVFTSGCPECEGTQAILSVEVELRLAVRDLWLAGWTPADLVEEMRRRTGSADARDVVVRALLAEDVLWADQAKSDTWAHDIAVLAATSGIDAVAAGWIARWLSDSDDPTAAFQFALDLCDELADARRSGRR